MVELTVDAKTVGLKYRSAYLPNALMASSLCMSR